MNLDVPIDTESNTLMHEATRRGDWAFVHTLLRYNDSSEQASPWYLETSKPVTTVAGITPTQCPGIEHTG